ncbi:DUF885 domain-containing protein [Aliidiomarina minuta]|uniref:DUF885 domain-containing protein n=1 Tax=Aliidiomarina minuta TaxID=880057 RepID=A0A432WA86_9GAMM|nr:DUF885 domain-containing protein [Aliidiomarina minuta]RUO26945.1 DUF885 domain-containing protein [Aliidiomarina minuta]
MRNFLLGGLALALTACASAPQQETQPPGINAEFTQLAEQAWEYNQEQRHPDDRLLDISPQALQERHAQRREYYQQLEALDASQLDEQNQINRDMIMYALANQIDQYEFNAHLIPLTNESGFHSRIASLPNSSTLRSEEDYRNYLSRLQAIPAHFEQQIEYMREGLNRGITQPAVVLTNFPAGIMAYVKADPRESVFYAPFNERPRNLSRDVFSELEMEAQTIIATQVNDAYQDFHDFMVDDYIPNARDTIAAHDLPRGEAFYRNRALHYTTTDLTVEEIHQIGLDEVARIRAEMMEVIESVEFDGSFDEFIEFLRNDPQFYADSAEELLKEAAYIAKQADAALPRFFTHLPRTPYGVAPVPDEIAPNYTTGRYVSARQDDQPGYYWVNTYALDRRPLYELEALTLHEGVPGHHLQIALAQEMDHLPDYRRNTYISAFGEGWGLYAEYLGLEAGFYQDPYSNFGRLTYEMWRAARLVVDTGMHTMGWSRDRAVEFLASNTALSMHNVNTEIDRYISWPAQALSYKLGELKIKELRAEAEETLGDDFDLREFHDEVLSNGSVPLQTLEDQIRAYIQRKQS